MIKDLFLHCACGDKKCKSLLITNYDKFIEITIGKHSIIIYPSQIRKILKFLKEYNET